jgi:hypothetical protein
VTADDCPDGCCPWCGGPVADTAPAATVAPPVPTPPPPATHVEQPQWLLGGGLVVLLVLLAVAVTVVSIHNAPAPVSSEPATGTADQVLAVRKDLHETRLRRGLAKHPASQQPNEAALDAGKQHRDNDSKQPTDNDPPGADNHRRPLKDAVQRPNAAKDPAASKAVEIVETGTERKLFLPEGTYTLPLLAGKAKLKLRGVVKTLKVDAMDNEAELDVSGLEAQEIVFGRLGYRCKVKLKGTTKSLKVNAIENEVEFDATALEVPAIAFGRIGYRSKVKLSAPGGTVEFRALVDNQCTLTVLAPRGSVTFLDRIDNDARVNITAREVGFKGVIAGNQTNVQVTLTAGGQLQFREVAGTARLEYRKEKASDPPPAVKEGTIGMRAKVGLIQ